MGAVTLADRSGLEALTMRNLAHELGVEAMSLYYHVANKEAVLDGVAEVVLAEIKEAVGRIDAPSTPAANGRRRCGRGFWQPERSCSATDGRPACSRHAPASARPRCATSTPYSGCFAFGGFSYDLAHHALHALGSRALGFTQELFEPDDGTMGDRTTSRWRAWPTSSPTWSGCWRRSPTRS